jgi:hypothetical protein
MQLDVGIAQANRPARGDKRCTSTATADVPVWAFCTFEPQQAAFAQPKGDQVRPHIRHRPRSFFAMGDSWFCICWRATCGSPFIHEQVKLIVSQKQQHARRMLQSALPLSHRLEYGDLEGKRPQFSGLSHRRRLPHLRLLPLLCSAYSEAGHCCCSWLMQQVIGRVIRLTPSVRLV